jgi:lactoylglutathione lyase
LPILFTRLPRPPSAGLYRGLPSDGIIVRVSGTEPCQPVMTRLAHVAVWTDDIDRLASFYVSYFGARAGRRYANDAKGFESLFLSFDGGGQLEIMRTTRLTLERGSPGAERAGLAHVAVSVGSAERVDALTRRIAADGHPVVDGPRRTGDGYYESVVLDPDGTRVEVTA